VARVSAVAAVPTAVDVSVTTIVFQFFWLSAVAGVPGAVGLPTVVGSLLLLAYLLLPTFC
jgi:hypothetical protein